MIAYVTSLLLLAGSGALAALLSRRRRLSGLVGAGGAAAGCVAGLFAACEGLFGSAPLHAAWPWLTPLGGSARLWIDPLAALFLAPLYLVCGVAAVYGRSYLDAHGDSRPAGGAWLFYNLLVAAMALVLAARNGLLLLFAWEAMAIASFFLVVRDHESAPVRRAGFLYLVASHIGTAFLAAFVFIMAGRTGSLDFDAWQAAGQGPGPGLAALLFGCALVGFGTKAGFMPLHVWLPEAHPAAPSHVSAVMSGVMIKTGIYGLVRVLPWLGAPPLWWGWVLVAVGLSSGVLGVLFALVQHDVKRLLAYSSVENLGVIALGLGVGQIGLSLGLPSVAAFGFAGALLHVVNHALFKSLLFLGAGAVYRATGSREVDALGGLLKPMPVTGACMLVGAAAISGLPPLSGFAGEFLVYWGSVAGVGAGPLGAAAPLLAAVGGLALIGGLAAACFAKLFGIVFLGEPRRELEHAAADAPPAMRVPMVVLALACIAIGPALPVAARALRPALEVATGLSAARLDAALAPGAASLRGVAWASALLGAGVLALALARRRLLASRPVRRAVTWDCGYARPTARMQYTGSSFTQPLVALFAGVLRTRRRFTMGAGLFPAGASLHTDTRDVFRERLFAPLAARLDRWLFVPRRLQAGRVQFYVLYILLTLLALLFWVLGRPA